jgi:hypothetical protein
MRQQIGSGNSKDNKVIYPNVGLFTMSFCPETGWALKFGLKLITRFVIDVIAFNSPFSEKYLPAFN